MEKTKLIATVIISIITLVGCTTSDNENDPNGNRTELSITAGIALNDKSSTSGEKETTADKATAQAVDQMSTVATEMIRKNMNIAPTLKIRPGYKFNIFLTKDIILEPLNIEKGE